MSTVSDEQPGLPQFPEIRPPNAIEREVVSDDGSLRLAIYRVGFQIHREHRNEFEPWLRYFKAKIETGDGKQIGYLTYRLINGKFIDDFHEEFQMSEHGAEQLELLGHLLFTEDGALQEKWRIGASSGTQIFGPELNATGVKFALLDCHLQDHLVVDEQFRRRGIALWAVHTLFKLLKEEGVNFIVTWPSTPRIKPERRGTPNEERLLRRNTAFVRKAGFRRVGLSPVFAYVLQDENHPSHRLTIENDMDPA